MNDKYLSVSTISRYLKHILDTDSNLQNVFIKGEISNLKIHNSGHMYFSLKDETSKINAIMFSNNVKKLNFKPIDGMKVLVIGRISLYEATGNYQIYIEEMKEDGLGNLYIAFEQLKNKLQQEGLFDLEHKKAIPKYPSKIGVVTAKEGAAIKDIISTIKRRYPIAEIILFPSLVQGDLAKDDLVKKIKQADLYNVDVIIVGRGGGSIEDLWPFNEEVVARTIYNAKTPIISAVGHEVDFTIADFVSDLRAPTPTAAAELAVPNLIDTINLLKQINIRLNENMLKKVKFNQLLIEGYKNSFVIKNPIVLYENKKQKIDLINEKINMLMKHNILLRKKELGLIIDKIELLNPLSILKRGYSLTYKNEKIIKSVTDVNINDNLKIKMNDGLVSVLVKEIENEI